MNNDILLTRARNILRVKHYSIRTEEAYLQWIKRFIHYHEDRHPSILGEKEISNFLSHLAVKGKVAASTQNQALSSLLFLYREVLKKEVDWIDDIQRAKKPSKLPVVFTKEEAKSILLRLEGTKWLMVSILYGSGLRLMECIRLRVKDIDFGSNQIIVRDGKGNKDRVTMLPASLKEHIKQHLMRVKALHIEDLEEGFGRVYLPYALAKKYSNTDIDWGVAVCIS